MKIKRRTFEKTRNWLLILFVTLTLGFFYKLYVEKDWFLIQAYTIIGVSKEEEKQIITKIQRKSSGVTLYVFPKDKILTYSHEDIVAAVTHIVPSASDVIVSALSKNAIKIEVKEFVPVMKISDTLGVTKEGVVFSTNRSLSNVPYFNSATTTTSFKENGFVFNKLSSFDSAYIQSLSTFLQKIDDVLFPITSISIDEKEDVTLFSNAENTRILITKKTDLEKAWSTLVSAIDTDPLKASLAKERERLLYIDLRFGNKVFYQFGNKDSFQNGSSTVIINDHDRNTTEATSTPR